MGTGFKGKDAAMYEHMLNCHGMCIVYFNTEYIDVL